MNTLLSNKLESCLPFTNDRFHKNHLSFLYHKNWHIYSKAKSFNKYNPISDNQVESEDESFSTLIDKMSLEDAKTSLELLENVLNLAEESTNKEEFVAKSIEDQEKIQFFEQVFNLIKQLVEMLEEKIHSNYAYNISVNYKDNDWNNPENDHWDNY